MAVLIALGGVYVFFCVLVKAWGL